MAYPRAYASSGMAIFSTRAGQHCQRQHIPGMSLVIRSDPPDDRDTMAARLQSQFPAICRNIVTLDHRGGDYVNDYFDDYDQHVQGTEFLRAVLVHIAQSNAMRAREVQDLLSRWMATNTEAFALLGPEHLVEHVFTEEDIEQYEMGLLEETLRYIQHAAALRDEVSLQEQFQTVLHKDGGSIFFQAPKFTKIPPQQPVISTPRVTSNPEKSQVRQRQGPAHQIPPPLNRYSTPHGRYPQQRLTPSTEVLEHIHPGSTNRGDFHSDPTIKTFDSPYMDYNVAIPSRGLSGPFSYASLPRVSLSERQRVYNSSALPKGKKNPAKKSSDDARKAVHGGSSRRQSSICRSSGHFGVPHLAESPSSTDTLREDQLSNMQIGPVFQGAVRDSRPVTNALLGQAEGVMVQDGTLRVADSGHGPQRRPRPIQAQGSHMQTLDPHNFGRQIPSVHLASQDLVKLTANDDRWPRHPFEDDHRQLQPEQALIPVETRASQRMGPEYLLGNRIFVGNIPIAFDRAMIEGLLKPCRGLQSIVEPRINSQKSNIYTYVFAYFSAQNEAEEALARLPQTHFKCLGERNFLRTSWPIKYNPNQPQNQNFPDARLEQAMRHTSPTTTRKSKASDPVKGEASEETSYFREGSVKSAVVGETKERGERVTTVMEPINPPYLDSTQAPGMAVSRFASVHPTGVSKPTGVSSNSTAVSPEDQNLAAAYDKPAGQANQSDKPRPPHISPHNMGPSTVDGTSDPTHVSKPTDHMEQEPYGSNPRQPANDPKSSTTATKKVKKSNQKSKSSNKPQNIKETQNFRAVSLSENTKPTATIEAKTTSVASPFLTEAAHSDSEDVAAEARNAEVEATNCVAIPDPPLPTTTPPKAQLLTSSSILTTLPKKATLPAWPESKEMASAPFTGSPEKASPTDSDTEAGLPVKPLSNGAPIHGKQQAAGTVNGSKSAWSALGSSLEGKQDFAPRVMSRDGSTSTNVEDSGELLYQHSTAPTSYLQTERSNSLADGSWTSTIHSNEASPIKQTRSAGVDPEHLRSILQTDIKATIGAGHIVEPSDNKVDGESRKEFAPDMSNFSPKSLHKTIFLRQQGSAEMIAVDEDTKEFAVPCLDKALQDPTVATSPHILASAIDPAEPRGPDREQGPVIPVRSSSLPRLNSLTVDAAPVLTRHKKKNSRTPKHHVPAEEKAGSSGSKQTADLAEEQPIDAGVTASEQTKPPSPNLDAKPKQSQPSKPRREEFEGAPSRTIKPGLGTPSPTKLSKLPEPETPFRLDGEATSPAARHHRQHHSREVHASTGYGVVVQSDASQRCVEIGFSHVEKNAINSSQELRRAMEEAGYLTSVAPTSAFHFVIKDPILARLGELFEQEEQSKLSELQDDKIHFSEKGKTFMMDRAEMQKQIETRAFLEKAAAGKRLQEGLPLRTPTKNNKGKGKAGEVDPIIKSLCDRIEKIALHNILVKATRGEREVGDSHEDRMAKEAKILLDTSPTHRSSRKYSMEWAKKAELFIKGSKTPDVSRPSTPTRKSKTGDVHESSASLVKSLHKQGKLPESSPVVTTKPGFKTAVIKLKPGEDASQTATDHLTDPDALFGTGEVKLSSLEEIYAAFAKPGGAMTLLSSEERQARVSAQSEPLEKKAVGYWNQNSGFKDSDTQDETRDDGSDVGVVRSQDEDGVSASQSHDSSRKLSQTQDTGTSREPEMNQIPSMRTSRDQCEEAPRHNCDKSDMSAGVATEARADGQQMDELACSPSTVTGDYSDAEPKNVKSVLGSESGDTAESRQDDAEYPVLPRGRSSHLKGGESRAPSKGGYAAAARKSIDEKREIEAIGGRKQGNKDMKEDPWAPEDVWGPGKSDQKSPGVSRGYIKRGGG